MKLKTVGMIALTASALPLSAFAHGTKLEQVSKSTTTVIAQLEKDDNETILDAFTGVKAWIDGDKIQVKIYLTPAVATAPTFVQYTCIDHHMGDAAQPMTMCTKN